jgi:hypothetical protein
MVALNQACYGAFHQLNRRFENIEAENKVLRASLARQGQNIQQLLELVRRNPQPPQIPPPAAIPQLQLPPPPVQEPQLGVPVPVPALAPPPPPQAPRAATPRNINDVLQPSAQQPQVPPRMPKTLTLLYSFWIQHDLDRFVRVVRDRRNWQQQNRIAFERSEYLVRHIRQNAAENNLTDQESVAALQASMGTKSCRQYHDQLKKDDPNVIRRNYPVARRMRPVAQAARAQQARNESTRIPPGPNRQQPRLTTGRPRAVAPVANPRPPGVAGAPPLINQGRAYTVYGDGPRPPWENQEGRRPRNHWAHARAGIVYGFGEQHAYGRTSGQRPVADPDDEEYWNGPHQDV